MTTEIDYAGITRARGPQPEGPHRSWRQQAKLIDQVEHCQMSMKNVYQKTLWQNNPTAAKNAISEAKFALSDLETLIDEEF